MSLTCSKTSHDSSVIITESPNSLCWPSGPHSPRLLYLARVCSGRCSLNTPRPITVQPSLLLMLHPSQHFPTTSATENPPCSTSCLLLEAPQHCLFITTQDFCLLRQPVSKTAGNVPHLLASPPLCSLHPQWMGRAV